MMIQGKFHSVTIFYGKKYAFFVNRNSQIVDVRELLGYQKKEFTNKKGKIYTKSVPIFADYRPDTIVQGTEIAPIKINLYYSLYGNPISSLNK